MNIVFWLLVIAALVLIWLCLSFAFKAIGGFALKLFNDAKETMNEEEKENPDNEG